MTLSHGKIVLATALYIYGVNGLSRDQQKVLEAKWNTDWAFSGISTFAHLPYVKCLTHPDEGYDIAIIGAPFDTAVSYRPGARFGPRALRAASARQLPYRSYNPRAGLNPYDSALKIIDCGDIPITPFDNRLALQQMSSAYLELGQHSSAAGAEGGQGQKPKLVTLGGDHSIALPALRALRKIHGQRITVLHFDAHLDTWHPGAYPSAWNDPSQWADPANPTDEEWPSAFNHGSMFWLAGREGLISSAESGGPSNVHAGLRTRLAGVSDRESDESQGWRRIASDAVSADLMGPIGLAREIVNVIGVEVPVYLSVDIDVIDPGLAPGTGTPEPGGWTTRELVRVLREIGGKLNVVGADLVEVAPAYDGAGEQTALAGAQIVYELVTCMVERSLGEKKHGADGTGNADKEEL